MFKNEYIRSENFVTIILKNRKGERYECYVDNSDFERILELDLSWHLLWSRTTKSYYTKATEYHGLINGKPKYKTVLMHRILTDCPRNMTVDHLNYNTLDNRRSNLEVVSLLENNKNRQNKANRNSQTGVRHVTYDKICRKYVVQFYINGKNTQMGRFDTLDEAKDYADRNRHKYYTNVG